jgi:hypothetical protein
MCAHWLITWARETMDQDAFHHGAQHGAWQGGRWRGAAGDTARGMARAYGRKGYSPLNLHPSYRREIQYLYCKIVRKSFMRMEIVGLF